MKHLLFFLLLLLFAVSGKHTLKAQETENANTIENKPNYTLLWEITGNGLTAPSYLFGSMHVTDRRAFEFPDSLYTAIEQCQAFAAEVHFDSMMTNVLSQALKDEKTLSDFSGSGKLSSDFGANRNVDLDKEELNDWFYKIFKRPSSKTDKATFVDAYLNGVAKRLNKSLYGLEGFSYHMNLTSHYDADYKWLPKVGDVSANKTIETYQSGDIIAMQSLMELTGIMTDSITIKRNYDMVDKIQQITATETLFSVVGTAHLPGPEGMISILKDRGYILRPVQANFTDYAATALHPVLADSLWFNNTFEGAYFNFKSPNGAMQNFPIDMLGEDLSAEMFDVEMRFFPDIGTGIYYYVFDINYGFPFLKSEQEDLMKTMSEGSFFKGRKIISSDSVSNGGIDGIEVVFKTRDKTISHYRAQIFYHNNHLSMFYIGGKIDKVLYHSEANYFFNNIRLAPPEKANKKWRRFSDDVLAFEVDLPERPKLSVQNADSMYDTDNFTIYNYSITNKSIEQSILVQVMGYPRGVVVDNDSTIFASLLETYNSRVGKGNDISATYFKTPEGYSVMDIRYNESNDKLLTQAIRVYIRTNRLYILLIEAKKEDKATMNKVLDTFAFTSFLPIKLNTYEAQYDSLTALMPPSILAEDYFEDFDSYANSVYVEEFLYTSIDTATNTAFTLGTSHLNKYFYVSNIDSFLTDYKDNYIDYTDTIINTKDILYQNKYPGKRVKYQGQNAFIYKELQYFLRNNVIYYCSVNYPPELEGNEAFNTFFNSLTFLDDDETFDVRKSKAEQLMSDLYSNDSTTFHQAKSYLEYYEFEEEDFPLLYEALYYNFTLDSSAYYSVQDDILYILDYVNDETSLPVLCDFYRSDTTNTYTSRTLATISYQNTAAAWDSLFVLLNDYKSEYLPWSAQSVFIDSVPLTQKYYDKLLAYSQHNPSLRSQFIDICQSTLANPKNTEEQKRFVWDNYATYLAMLEQDLADYTRFSAIANTNADERNEIEAIEEPELYYYPNLLAHYVGIKEDAVKYLYKIEKNQEQPETTYRILSILLEKGVSVPKTWINQLIANDYYRFKTVDLLNKYQQLKTVKKQQITTEQLALSMIKMYMYDYDGYEVAVDMELLEDRIVDYKGKEVKVFIYKYAFVEENQKSKEWYLAMAGPFPIKGKIKTYKQDLLEVDYYDRVDLLSPRKLSRAITKFVENTIDNAEYYDIKEEEGRTDDW